MIGTDASAPASPLTIVHLCAPADVGGLERVVQGLATGQARRGHLVTVVAVVTPDTDTGPLFAPMGPAGVNTFRLELGARAYLRERRSIDEMLDRLRPDVLHTHGYRPDLLHGWSARRRGIASVTTLHGSSRMGGMSHLFEWVQERALRWFDGVVAVSRPLADLLARRGVSRERLHYVPNAWAQAHEPLSAAEARARLGLPPAGPVIGWIGRLVTVKGADVFLRALARLPGADWTACLIGDGPERAALEALTTELGLAGRVRFAGAVHEAARYYGAFDLFAMSSHSEGAPIVLLEAMGAGTPVVATGVGGIPFMLAGGDEGWVVPVNDAGALADAMRAVLSDPGEARRRAARAAERVRREFDPDLWIRKHEALYREAMAIRRRG